MSNILNAAQGFNFIAQFKRNQWKSPEEIRQIQEEKLKKLLLHASSNVPFYRKIDPYDFKKIGALEKTSVRQNSEAFLDKTIPRDKLNTIFTSGSTGVPISVHFSKSDSIYGIALKYHCLTECGFGPMDLLAMLTVQGMAGVPLRRWLYRIVNFDNKEPPAELSIKLRALRPSVVLAYPSVFSLLARENDLSETPQSFKAAISSSETLSEKIRTSVQKSFNCRLRNYFGINESWAIAFECEEGSLHLNSDSVIMEVLDEDGNEVPEGKRGELVLTSLWRYSMPFIRYRTGDFGSMGGRCRCGRGTSTLRSLDGREWGMIILPSGREISYTASISNRPIDLDFVVQFQVIQEPDLSLRIICISRRNDEAAKTQIKNVIQGYLPEKLGISVEFEDSIERTKNGKELPFISKVRS
jgi:phenylacetate-CoA ligase